MLRNVSYRAGLVFIVALGCARLVYGQDSYSPEHREWEVSGFVGRSFGAKFQFPTQVIGNVQEPSRTVGMRYDSGYLLGVRINQNLGDYWNADLEYSFANQWLRFTNLSPSIQSLSLDQYVHRFSYDVSFVALPRTRRFRPYAGAGIGAALFYLPGRVKKDALELGLSLRDSWELLFNFGGGVKYLVMDGFALTFDVKDRLSSVPSYGLPLSARVVNGFYQPGISSHGIVQTPQVSLGFTYQWDEP